MADHTSEPTGSSNASSTRNLGRVFPLSKIKSILQQSEDVGSITQPALELIGALSAAFLSSLVKAAVEEGRDDPSAPGDGGTAKISTPTNQSGNNEVASSSKDAEGSEVLRLSDLQRVAQQYARFHFLRETLRDPDVASLDDQRPTKRPKRKMNPLTRKSAPTSKNAVSELEVSYAQVAELAEPTGLAKTKDIIVDDEDYD